MPELNDHLRGAAEEDEGQEGVPADAGDGAVVGPVARQILRPVLQHQAT